MLAIVLAWLATQKDIAPAAPRPRATKAEKPNPQPTPREIGSRKAIEANHKPGAVKRAAPTKKRT